jgi:hypothetical protein
MDEKMSLRRGQLAVWVIVAVILVASILLFLLIDRKVGLLTPGEGEATFDVESYIGSCSNRLVKDVTDSMLPQGGFVKPNNTVMFNNINIEYICENVGFYEPCIQQHPLLIREMENEIKANIFSDVNDCFDKMKSEFESRGSKVNFRSDMNLDVDLQKDKVVLNIKRKVEITKNDETRSGESFVITIPNPTYNLARIAAEIADQEAKYCNFEFVGYNIIYPRYQIKKYSLSNPTDVYTIIDLHSGKQMNIAIRGCAVPAGI